MSAVAVSIHYPDAIEEMRKKSSCLKNHPVSSFGRYFVLKELMLRM